MALGRDICGDWSAAISREWLATNGVGGYACGTVAGANTRRYHGFLIASLAPPVQRMLLVSKVDLSVDYLGRTYPLAANEFSDGTVDPRGFVYLQSFAVDIGVPTWRYAFADALVQQRIYMAPGENTTYLRLDVLRASASMKIEFKPLVTHRDYHVQARGQQTIRSLGTGSACAIAAADGTPLFRLSLAGGRYVATDTWYWNFFHREEFARGLDALEDLYGPGIFETQLDPGQSTYFTATAEAAAPPTGDGVLTDLARRAARLVDALPKTAPAWIQSLAIATDQFIVRRGSKQAGAISVIAGYPWFTDWGRDAMIALPGLATALGRHDTAAAVLRTYAAATNRGMLPNHFPDAGESIEYNTADATLWMFHAVSEQLKANRDPALLAELFPTLASIIHAHAEGTRYGIRVDPADGLLHAGTPGCQLTWMDARQGDLAVTPRVGKPVEINALWLNALEVTARLAGRLRAVAERAYCVELLQRASAGYSRFWNADRGCLFDVIDVDGGATNDPSVRPNQILAVSLPYCVLSAEHMRAVVDTCARELLTSYGLRSLNREDPHYAGAYTGNSWQRDGVYHQGTVWAWLLGPFARAHYRVYGDAASAQGFLAPIAEHLASACLGSVSEIFDGDAPHNARGCFAQAWSVAEILRSWIYLERKIYAN